MTPATRLTNLSQTPLSVGGLAAHLPSTIPPGGCIEFDGLLEANCRAPRTPAALRADPRLRVELFNRESPSAPAAAPSPDVTTPSPDVTAPSPEVVVETAAETETTAETEIAAETETETAAETADATKERRRRR